MRFIVLLGAGVLTLTAGCHDKAADAGDGGDGDGDGGTCGVGPGGVAGCTVDDTIACTGGALGFECNVSADPEVDDPSYSCTAPQVSPGCIATYCCFSSDAWTSSACVPDVTVPAACPAPDSYGYQCASGRDPTSLVASLHCTGPSPDPDAVHDDYCCTY
jgi:hypothetical protein